MEYGDEKIREELGKAISNTSNSSEKVSDRVRAASTLFMANTVEGLISEIKKSRDLFDKKTNSLGERMRELEKSNDRHALWMKVLTGALVIVGLLDIFLC